MFRFGRKKTTTAYMIAAGISVVAVSFIPHGTNNTGKKAQFSLILIRSQVNEYWIFIRYITIKSAMVRLARKTPLWYVFVDLAVYNV